MAAESKSSLKIKTLRTDHGGEFNSKAFSDFFLQSGIKKQLSAPYSPQQNGVVERRNRIILNMVRSMLKEKKLLLIMTRPRVIDLCSRIFNFTENTVEQRQIER